MREEPRDGRRDIQPLPARDTPAGLRLCPDHGCCTSRPAGAWTRLLDRLGWGCRTLQCWTSAPILDWIASSTGRTWRGSRWSVLELVNLLTNEHNVDVCCRWACTCRLISAREKRSHRSRPVGCGIKNGWNTHRSSHQSFPSVVCVLRAAFSRAQCHGCTTRSGHFSRIGMVQCFHESGSRWC